jgi:hypothetical protein
MNEEKRRNFEFALFPVIKSPSGVRYFSDAIEERLQVKTWIYQTLFPRREKFVIDLVGLCRNGRILHIEQETSPKEDLPIRMLEYSSMLLMECKLNRPIIQIVYYTGDKPKIWEEAEEFSSGVFVRTYSLGYLQFRYVIIDAGQPSSTRIKNAAAALGLLTRDQNQAVEIVRTLVKKILLLRSEQERADAIVACDRIASLRGWNNILTEEMLNRGMRKMSENEAASAYSRTFARTYLDFALRLIEKNERISLEEIRPYLNEDALRIGQLERLIEFAQTAKSGADLLDSANIEYSSLTLGS